MVYVDVPVRDLEGWHLNYAVARYVCKLKVRVAHHLPHRFYTEENFLQPVERVVDGVRRVVVRLKVKRKLFLPVEHKRFSKPVIDRLRLQATEVDEGWSCRVGRLEPFIHFHSDIALLRAAVALSAGAETVKIPFKSKRK